MKTLETKLNKEYEGLGIIKINSCHEETLKINDIDYLQSIMGTLEPLNSDEPIVVAKSWRKEYKLIDGYHRLKNKISIGSDSINTIVLDDYKLNRINDCLFNFLEKTVGKTIKFTDSNTLVIGGKIYLIEDNEGCGGCSSGWSSIEVLPDFLNKEIKVKTIESKDSGKEYDDVYSLYINGNKVARVDTGYGNGYYGGDFEVKHIN
jgi:hypothetical protein